MCFFSCRFIFCEKVSCKNSIDIINSHFIQKICNSFANLTLPVHHKANFPFPAKHDMCLLLHVRLPTAAAAAAIVDPNTTGGNSRTHSARGGNLHSHPRSLRKSDEKMTVWLALCLFRFMLPTSPDVTATHWLPVYSFKDAFHYRIIHSK